VGKRVKSENFSYLPTHPTNTVPPIIVPKKSLVVGNTSIHKDAPKLFGFFLLFSFLALLAQLTEMTPSLISFPIAATVGKRKKRH
jgi:hypothetical protein